MPRGGNNEAKGQLTDIAGNAAFAASIQGEFGSFQNAEDLILAHQGNQDPALRRAGLTQVDVEATDALKQADAAKKFDLADGERLDTYAVRGNALVGVLVNDETGSLRKAVVGANDDYKEPTLSPEQTAMRVQAERDQKLAAEAARLRADMEAELADHVADLQEDMQKQMDAMREKADKDLEKARKDAGLDKSTPESSTPAKSDKE